MHLIGKRLRLRPVLEPDHERLLAIVREPGVAPWWGDYDLPRLRAELDETETLAIEREGEVVGLLMISEETDPQYRHAGLDISLADAHQGQGLAREALRLVIDHLVTERGHHRITIDPAAENERAIRCYRAAGFRPVGVMRRYQRTAEGSRRDGLLMELVVED